MKATNVRHQSDDRQPDESQPATTVGAIWGSVLPIPTGPGVSDDFEARVRRTWEHLKAAYFAVEEHDRLREELSRLIAKESSSEYQ